MPWTMDDYPQSWKNFDELERKKAIDIGNSMLKGGYKEGDVIPIATPVSYKNLTQPTHARGEVLGEGVWKEKRRKS